MPLKKIKPGEEFVLDDQVFTYSVEGNSIHLKKVRKIFERSQKAKFIPPTIEQVKAYFKENGYREDVAETFFKGYENGDPPWHDSRGNPVKAWKQKAIQVWFKPEAKIKEVKQGGQPFFKE